MIPRLPDDPTAPFPPVKEALEEPDGLLAWGGDLSPRRLQTAYRAGIFPWYSDDEPILWWCPARRCVIDTGQVHVARSLARLLGQQRFEITADRDFEAVVDGCARGRSETWITPAMRDAYLEMHELGHGHSIEAWHDGKLAGGLYGLAFGRMFFGESMYSSARDASKVVLVTLCRVLKQWRFPWLDCQVPNPHLERMGALMIDRAHFCKRLHGLFDQAAPTGPWTGTFAAALDKL